MSSIALLGIGPVAIIGDAQFVILEVLGESSCPTNCIPIVEEVRDLIKTSRCLGIFWKRRAFNLAAHEFAHFAKFIFGCNLS